MVVILTGATSGIGFEVLKQIVVEGHKVYTIGRDFSKIIDYFGENNSRIVNTRIDLHDTASIAGIFEAILNNGEKVDAFVNCAGYEETIPLKQYSGELISNIFSVNVFSTIEFLRFIAQKKYSNDGASVVLFSSVMGNLGQPGKVGYCSSKAAVNGIVKSAALELSKRRIRVNSISPGIVNTELTQKLFDKIGEQAKIGIIEQHPLGIGEPEDIVPAVLFLISGNSKWITGTDIVIDGGYSAK